MPSPTPQPPIRLTIDDFHQTRHTQPSQHMHWPVDEETRRRLKYVIAFSEQPLPWYRRLLRWLVG